MVRGIRPHVVGRAVNSVRRCRCACKPLAVAPSIRQIQSRTRGRTIAEVSRLGKRVVLRLDSTDAFVIEPRMTGLMLIADPPDQAHLRIHWQLQDDSGSSDLWFWDRRGLGTVCLWTADEYARLQNHALGPDALSATAADWKTRCRQTRRAVKVAMLDQKWMAGIGNLYACEILHHAGLSPFQAACELSDRQIAKLTAATQEVLREAIRYEGSTLSDGTYRNALNQTGTYQNAHKVYNKAGQVCPTCDAGEVQRVVQAQRSTFYCPQCQQETV